MHDLTNRIIFAAECINGSGRLQAKLFPSPTPEPINAFHQLKAVHDALQCVAFVERRPFATNALGRPAGILDPRKAKAHFWEL